MQPVSPKDVMQQFMDDAWSKRLPDACERHLAPDFRHYMPGSAEPEIGREPYQATINYFISAFPDLTMTVEELFGEGENVCVRWRATGTHLGEFAGRPPTGQTFVLHGAGVAKAAGGMLTQSYSMFDNASFLSQLGPVPT